MSTLRRFLPKMLLAGLFLSAAIFPLVGQDGGTASDPLTAKERAFVAAHGPIRYAPDPLFPPFEFLDSSGNARGITPELLAIMGKRLGVEFRTVAYPTWSDVLDAVKEGKVDLLGTLTRTPQREGFLLFSRPYLSVPYVLFVRQDGDHPKTVEDMVSRRLGVVRNYGINTWLSAAHPKVRPVTVEDTATGLTMVATGQLDGLIETLPVGAQIVRDRSLTNIRVVPRHIYTLPQHFGVRRDQPLLLSIVQKGLDSLTETERSEAFVRWTGQDFSRPPPAIPPLLRNAIFVLAAAAVLSWAWIVALRRSVRRSTRSLRESEEKLRAVVDGTTDAVYIKDLQGRYLQFNAAASRFTGKSAAEAIGNDDTVLFPADEAKSVMEGDRGVMASGKVMTYEERITTADGKKRTFLSTKGPMFDENGNVVGLFGIARDVTMQRWAEEALRESETRYRSIFNSLADGIVIVDPDTTTLIDFNEQACAQLGYTREEFGRLKISDIETLEGPEEVEAHIRKVITAGYDEFETLHRTRNGEQRNVHVKAQYISVGGKSVYHCIWRDITERKRAETERDHLAAAIAQANETVLITDVAGNIEYVNPAFERTTGYSRVDVIGRNPRILNSGKQGKAFYRRLWETISRGKTWEGRMVNRRKDGVLYTEEATISPVFDPTGRIVNYVAVKRDITEHLRLTDQLQQALKMEAVGRLAGGVAHDFNNLLTVIKGYCELLLQKVGRESPLHGELEEIRRAGERAASLTQQLLAFSRKQIVEPKVVHLDRLVADVHAMLTRLIGEDIALETITGKALGAVKVDPGQFQQILMNLAVNARDAMPGGGKLVIETANAELDVGYCALHPYVAPGRFVMLSVSDTGLGIGEEVRAHIFEPFFTTKERGSGTGLGLATTYGAVRQAGGSIDVESEIGKGTTFRIYLPRVEEEAAKPVKDDRPPGLPGGSETVLLVEDEDAVRNLCSRILTELGYRVMPARNGAEAIAAAVGWAGRIDLLLTDVVMPGMYGNELATQLVLHHPEMKVLFTSGYTDDKIAYHGVLGEEVSFIAKPYAPERLARKIREVLETA